MPKTKRIVPMLILAAMLSALTFALACGSETIVEVTREVEVVKEVEVEKVVEVEKEVEVVKEVEVEKVVEKEVAVEVEVTPTPVPLGYTDVPRSRTLIMAGLGGEHPGAFTDIEQFNAHAPGLSRSGLYQAASEGLFYFNMLTGELHPWMATDYEYDDGYTGVTVNIREGVEWSDGTPFTAHDVAYTLNMANTNPLSARHGAVNQWTDEATAIDDLTVHIKFHRSLASLRVGSLDLPRRHRRTVDPQAHLRKRT